MKKIISKINILFCTATYIVFLVISKIVLMLLEVEYMQYIYKFSFFVVIIGVVVGLIQLAHKSQSKSMKIGIISSMTVLGILIAVFLQVILLLYVVYFPPEHIVEKENKKMVGYVYGFLRTRVDYYEYINFFLRSEKIAFSEDYGRGGFDPIEDPNIHTVERYIYYDKNGNTINSDYTKQPNENKEQKEEKQSEQNLNYENGYEIIFNKKEGCRIDIVDWAMGKEAIKVYSTNDGENWTSKLETENGIMWVNYGAKFLFINSQIGFIYDKGRDGNPEDYATLKVTINGGKSYQECNIIHPNNITEKNLLIKDLPTYEEGILKLTVYTLNHTKEPKREYYEFTSSDGITWTYNKKISNFLGLEQTEGVSS